MFDKRAHPRVPMAADVSIVAGDAQLEARSRDASVGGMFVESSAALDIGTELSLTFRLPEGQTLTVPGTVRWHDPAGFGVQFGLLGAKETHALTKLMQR